MKKKKILLFLTSVILFGCGSEPSASLISGSLSSVPNISSISEPNLSSVNPLIDENGIQYFDRTAMRIDQAINKTKKRNL